MASQAGLNKKIPTVGNVAIIWKIIERQIQVTGRRNKCCRKGQKGNVSMQQSVQLSVHFAYLTIRLGYFNITKT
jgi:hypothetical protein